MRYSEMQMRCREEKWKEVHVHGVTEKNVSRDLRSPIALLLRQPMRRKTKKKKNM